MRNLASFTNTPWTPKPQLPRRLAVLFPRKVLMVIRWVVDGHEYLHHQSITQRSIILCHTTCGRHTVSNCKACRPLRLICEIFRGFFAGTSISMVATR